MTGIRADANKIIASGHVMRCITIARQIIRLGEKVTFFFADEESKSLFDDFANALDGVEAVVLGTDWQDMEGELPLLREEIINKNIDILLTDSYKVTKGYFLKLSEVCRNAYMDDLGKEAYPVDILINYSGFYESIGYDKLYEDSRTRRGEKTRFLLGLDYAPLREQFYEERTGPADEVQNIEETGDGQQQSESAFRQDKKKTFDVLLTAGGADMHGMLPGTLRELEDSGIIAGRQDETDAQNGSAESTLDMRRPVIHVVVGSLVSDLDAIRRFVDEHPQVILHEKVNDMAGLMRSCDIAVAAAGTMLTECAALRLPVIFYQVADNQNLNVQFWQKTGGMIFAGDVSGGDPAVKQQVLKTICDNIRDVTLDSEKLFSMSRSLEGITDGRGAQRIAKELVAAGRD